MIETEESELTDDKMKNPNDRQTAFPDRGDLFPLFAQQSAPFQQIPVESGLPYETPAPSSCADKTPQSTPTALGAEATPHPLVFPAYPIHPEDGAEYAGLYQSNYDDSAVTSVSGVYQPERNTQDVAQFTQLNLPDPPHLAAYEPCFAKTLDASSSTNLHFEECGTMPSDEIPASNSPVLSDEYQSEFTPSVYHAPKTSSVEPSGMENNLEPSGTVSPSAIADANPEPVLSLTDEELEALPVSGDADFGTLRATLMALQQQIRAAKIPVVIVFEGWDAAGKGTLLAKLIEGLDPRGYQVYPIHKLSAVEDRYPIMRQYWVKMPSQGNISLFCSSWYREVTSACFENRAARHSLRQRYEEIVNMESQLVCDGVLMIKFFLHISRKEQKKRLKALESKKNTRWRVTVDDWEQNDRYEDYLRLYDAMIARTHFDGAPWHILQSDDTSGCISQIYGTVIDAFRTALKDREDNLRAWDTPFLPHLESLPVATFPPLETFDPEQVLTEPYKPALDQAQKRLWKLQNELYKRKIPLIVCFEGWDAAGKGGAIRRLSASLDPRGFDVVPISAPTPLEKSHHHLWRFYQSLPRDGHVAIFDRTWYGRVMVERIEGFCTESQWKRAYEEINHFEAELTTHGSVLCKFWLQIDNDTQLTRFEERQNTPDKQWKITDEDWRNRAKWPQYETAVSEMLQKTNTASAPWTVIEANNKQFARLKVLQTVIAAVESRLEKD
jgi:polyphosphate:AMP phosphotransferase